MIGKGNYWKSLNLIIFGENEGFLTSMIAKKSLINAITSDVVP